MCQGLPELAVFLIEMANFNPSLIRHVASEASFEPDNLMFHKFDGA